jgi:TolB-like protein
MMLLLLVLSAAPLKMAAPGLQTVGMDPAVGALLVDRIAVLAKQPDLAIVTSRDVQQVLGFERQKQLLGCNQSDCVAELAGALGVDALLSGSVARVGTTVTLVLRVIRARDGMEVVSASTRVANEDRLQDWIEANAEKLGRQIVRRLRGEPEPTRQPTWLRWSSLGLGVAMGATGGILFGLSRAAANELGTANASSMVDLHTVATNGRSFEAAGIALMSVGGALLVTSVVLFALNPGDSEFALVPSPGGVMFAWGGRFP